jgi:hypothetical protein
MFLMSEVPLYIKISRRPSRQAAAAFNGSLVGGVSYERGRERKIFIATLLVRVHLIIEMSRPALRHGSLNSLFQVALYLPS